MASKPKRSHHKIKQWPCETREFSKIVRKAVEDGLAPNTTIHELNPIEPRLRQPYLILERSGKTNGPWAYTETFLHRAVRLHDYSLAEYLLESGAEVNNPNQLGRTALHEAVLARSWQAVGFLLKYGSDIEALTLGSDVVWYNGARVFHGEAGLTPMHLALHIGDVGIMRLLLAQGANSNHEVGGLWSYLDLALLSEHPQAVKLLLNAGLKLHKETFGFANPKESKSLAKKLRAYVTSYRLVPSVELWDSYREALSRLHFCKWAIDMDDDKDPPSAELIVTIFTEHLETLAGISRDYRELCDDCWQFEEELRYFFETEEVQGHEKLIYQTRPNMQALLETANREEWPCALCAYIADALDHREAEVRGKKNIPDQWRPLEGPVEIQIGIHDVSWSINKSRKVFEVSCGTMGLYKDGDPHGDNPDVDKFISWHEFVWLDASTLPSSYEPYDLVAGTGSRKASSVAKGWLEQCQQHHACEGIIKRKEGTTYRPKLIDVGNGNAAPRLVVHPDPDAQYVALSESSVDANPDNLKTTSENAEQHRVAISLESLSNVMQEAITDTRRLGFKFIWTDALCIIQDSSDAWSERAMHMHSVYDNAAVTISKHVDASGSLFASRISRSPYPVRLDVWQPKCRRPAYKEA